MKLSSFTLLTLFAFTSSAQAIKYQGKVRGQVAKRSLDEDGSSGDDDDHDDDDDEKKVKGPDRDCEWDIDDDGIEFKCTAKEGEKNVNEIKDEIKYKVSAKKSNLKIKINHEQEIETALQETEQETSFEVVVDRVIEYKKASLATAVASNSFVDDDSQAYDWNEDEIVQELLLDGWEDFSDVEEIDGLSQFSVSTVDKDVTGEGATFYFIIAQSDSGDITANKMKIDFELSNFPWVDEENYVALICTVESTSKVEVEFEDDKDDDEEHVARQAADFKINFGDTEGETNPLAPFGEFSWKTTADAAPLSTNTTDMGNMTDVVETIRVVATSPINGTEDPNSVAFSFIGTPAMGSPYIYWDPSAGVGYELSSFGFATTWTAVTLSGGLLTALAML